MGTSFSLTSFPCMTTLASRASNLSAEARSGVMSISLIQSCSATSWLNLTSNSSSAARFTGLRAHSAAIRESNPGTASPRVFRADRLRSADAPGARSPGDLTNRSHAGLWQSHRRRGCDRRPTRHSCCRRAPRDAACRSRHALQPIRIWTDEIFVNFSVQKTGMH